MNKLINKQLKSTLNYSKKGFDFGKHENESVESGKAFVDSKTFQELFYKNNFPICKKLKHEEQQTQIALVQYIHAQYPGVRIGISPGGLIDNARKGSLAKKLGYEAGTPDLIIFKPTDGNEICEIYFGLFIELKKESGGVVSEKQKEYQEYLNRNGYRAVVCEGFESAKKEIDNYLIGGN